MASFISVRHHGWRTQAAWTNILENPVKISISSIAFKLLEKRNIYAKLEIGFHLKQERQRKYICIMKNIIFN